MEVEKQREDEIKAIHEAKVNKLRQEEEAKIKAAEEIQRKAQEAKLLLEQTELEHKREEEAATRG